ncbi:MAG: protein translocase subunit SecD [Lachnospiraceae bacterium]|jgi:SecD/SecF fusion protein
MSRKGAVARLIAWLALLAFIGYTAIFGLGSDGSGSMNDITLGLDLRGGVSITYQTVEDVTSQELEDARNKLQQRAEQQSTEANVYTEGTNRITVEIPGATDANQILEELGKPGTLIFCTDSSDPEGTTVITGSDVVDAQPRVTQDSTTNATEYVVELTLTSEGREKFSEATAELYQNNDPIYIIYDGEVISAPTVQAHIDSETCEITGMSSYEAASDLASNIRIGALPVELEEIRSEVVGARLGQDAVRTSLLAGVIGLIIIFIFMIAYYRLPGAVASFGLLMYTTLVIVLVSTFKEEITLTLPGIAGIILGIGMAVDANCIIFSRIREEIGQGKAVRAAIEAGFSKAFSAILDGNVTTLIAAAVLFFLGSGTVKGFAETLALGIVVSMFTSLVVVRSVMRSLVALGAENEKLYGKVTETRVFDFIGKRKICYLVSSAVILVGIVSMIIHGIVGYSLNYSLEFVGGASTSAVLDQEYTVEELADEVEPAVVEAIGDTDVQITPVQNSSEVIIRTKTLSLDQRTALYDTLSEDFGADESQITTENISATVSSEMQRSAIIAVIVAAIFMLLYVTIRFRNFAFGATSVIPLIHDVLVLLAFYAVFRWTVGNTFIACMLTIVGYSINATIVIFDRIRENLKLHKGDMNNVQIVNLSISQTLTRSINTSLTTLIMVVVLFILGVTAIREFALPLIVGIICGCYSSVFIAGCLWYDFQNFLDSRAAKKKKAAAGKKSS